MSLAVIPGEKEIDVRKTLAEVFLSLFFCLFDKDFNEQSHMSNSSPPEGVGIVCVCVREGGG